ncbi:MAG: glycosyltransferase [bacterium]|nr:glycosyltransferase [bacterium]
MQADSKPRVVVFSLAYEPQIGGAEVAIRELMSRIPEYDFYVIAGAHKSLAPRYEKRGTVHVFRVGRYTSWLGRLNHYLYVPLAALRAISLHRKNTFAFSWAIMAAYGGGAAYLFNRLKGVPILLNMQEGDPVAHIEKRVSIFRKFFLDFFKRVTRIQAISTYLTGVAKHFGATAPMVVIPNGVDVARFNKRASLTELELLRASIVSASSAICIFSASRLEEKNGVDTLIRALVHDKRLELVVAGEGSLRNELEQLARELGVEERTHLIGSVPNDALPKYYHMADIFSRPSRSEGQGISFIEAFAAGVPVVGTDVDGISDFARDGENMIVIKAQDDIAVAKACVSIATNSSLRRTLIVGGLKTALLYGWDDIAPRMKKQFDLMISR